MQVSAECSKVIGFVKMLNKYDREILAGNFLS